MTPYTNALAEATVVPFEQARAASKTTIDDQSRARRLRDAAVSLARKGFRVFPLVPNAKTPAIVDWKERASNDPAKVQRMWTEALSDEPIDYNIGIATGNGLFVIDVDDKGGKSGSRSLRNLEQSIGALPVTLTAGTPSGGGHIYLRADPKAWIPNSVGKLGEGIDIRGDGGYVVAPGSVIDDRSYTIEVDVDVADSFEEWTDLVSAPRPAERIAAPTIDLDLPEAVIAATKWLQRHADLAIEGAGGDATTIRVANRVLDHGISVDQALSLMLDHWNDRCSPPWDADELRRKVENAERYRQSPVGASSAELEFDDVSDEVGAKAASASSTATSEKASRWRTLPASEVAKGALATTAYPLVQGLLNRNALSLFYGAPGQAKTFTAFVIAYCVAAGCAFAGRKVAKGFVLYVLAEGGASYSKRVLALDKVYGIPADLPLEFLPIAVNLRDRGELKSLLQAIREAEERAGLPCHLVVVDTLSRVLAGGDENSSTDMGEIIQNLDRLREKVGCHVLVIHHSGKDAAKGARGHSLARAAVDTEIEVKDGELIVRKQRDLEFISPLRFRLQSVELGIDASGEPVTSAVARFDVELAEEFEHALTEREEQMLRAYEQAAQEKYGHEYQRGRRDFYLSGPEWDAQMTKNLLAIGANGELSRQTLDAYRRKLTSKGFIEKGRRGQWLRGN